MEVDKNQNSTTLYVCNGQNIRHSDVDSPRVFKTMSSIIFSTKYIFVFHFYVVNGRSLFCKTNIFLRFQPIRLCFPQLRTHTCIVMRYWALTCIDSIKMRVPVYNRSYDTALLACIFACVSRYIRFYQNSNCGSIKSNILIFAQEY